ncbi:MAG: SDR family NAD(P)-dependent oxidoreductase [Candidatus Lokiarchaeota archaeon]|nr:SDR family NAD(P)-dependent oxidoreductase [Candidatus Lokiarchaeota archaeon]
MIKDFEGKVAVITGGASGIGRSLARSFAKRGCKIVLADVNKETLDKTAQELRKTGSEVLVMITDVSDREQVSRLAEASYDRFGKVNILCNNAGVSSGIPIQLLNLENWDWVLGVNLFGVIYGTKVFLNRMLESKEQCYIINTSSLAGLIAAEGGPYATSKFGVVAFSEILAQECFNTNVGVSVLCPGFVDTNIIKNIETLSQTRSGLFQPPPEMLELAKPLIENAEKQLKLGMDPDIMAEKVIKAITNDIFYVITHPEYMPIIKARFDRMQADALKLNENNIVKSKVGSKLYENVSPPFLLTYPDDLIELNPSPLTKQVFNAYKLGCDLQIFVSRKPAKMQLEDTTKTIADDLKALANEIRIISDQETKLSDGTLANEGIIECKLMGVYEARRLNLSVFQEKKWIRVTISGGKNNDIEDFKKIAYSLELK